MPQARTQAAARAGLIAMAAIATVTLAIAAAVGCPGGGCPDAPQQPVDAGRFANLLPGLERTRPAHRSAPARRPKRPAQDPARASTPHEHAPARAAKPRGGAPTRAPKPHEDAPARAPKPPGDAPARAPKPPADAPAPDPAPTALDVGGAADYVRAFYADLEQREFRAAWPRLAEDLRKRHGSFEAWERGFATTLRQSVSDVVAKVVGPATAQVSLTLTAVDRDEQGCEVTRRFAILWRLDHVDDEWHAVHAEGKELKPSPLGVAASCSVEEPAGSPQG